MDRFETAIVDSIIAEWKSDPGATPAPTGTVPMHGGGETTPGLNYASNPDFSNPSWRCVKWS